MVLKHILFRNNMILTKNDNVVGLGMQKTRHNGVNLSHQMKRMSIKGGATPVRRIEQRSEGGRVNRRPIMFMP